MVGSALVAIVVAAVLSAVDAALTLITGWDYLQAGLRHAGAQDTPAPEAAEAPRETPARP